MRNSIIRRALGASFAFAMSTIATVDACGLAWSPNPSDALKSAALTGRLAIVVFTGSDWSLKSAQLDQEILMNVEFTDFAVLHFALANADFPQRQQPAADLLAENSALATKHKITRWPTLLALRPDGTEAGRIEFSGQTPAEMIRLLEDWKQKHEAERSASAKAPDI